MVAMWPARAPIRSRDALIRRAETRTLRSLATGDCLPRMRIANSSMARAFSSLTSARAIASSALRTSEFRKAIDAFSMISVTASDRSTSLTWTSDRSLRNISFIATTLSFGQP